jgi:hydrogenase/urease accessory protein HupE
VRPYFALAVALACLPGPAQAHLVSTGLGPVYDGILHFAMTPEDILPVVALGALAGLRGKAHARCAIVALPLAWLVAGFAGDAMRVAMPDALAWLPLVAMGLLVAADTRLTPGAIVGVALALGAFLGYGNGAAMAQAGAGMRGVLGIVAAVLVLVALLTACAVAWRAGWMRIAWRVAGSWIAAGGLLLLGWSLR